MADRRRATPFSPAGTLRSADRDSDAAQPSVVLFWLLLSRPLPPEPPDPPDPLAPPPPTFTSLGLLSQPLYLPLPRHVPLYPPVFCKSYHPQVIFWSPPPLHPLLAFPPLTTLGIFAAVCRSLASLRILAALCRSLAPLRDLAAVCRYLAPLRVLTALFRSLAPLRALTALCRPYQICFQTFSVFRSEVYSFMELFDPFNSPLDGKSYFAEIVLCRSFGHLADEIKFLLHCPVAVRSWDLTSFRSKLSKISQPSLLLVYMKATLVEVVA